MDRVRVRVRVMDRVRVRVMDRVRVRVMDRVRVRVRHPMADLRYGGPESTKYRRTAQYTARQPQDSTGHG